MCAQPISICIPFSSLEGTTDVCNLKRILYTLFGRAGACNESSGASEKELGHGTFRFRVEHMHIR